MLISKTSWVRNRILKSLDIVNVVFERPNHDGWHRGINSGPFGKWGLAPNAIACSYTILKRLARHVWLNFQYLLTYPFFSVTHHYNRTTFIFIPYNVTINNK